MFQAGRCRYAKITSVQVKYLKNEMILILYLDAIYIGRKFRYILYLFQTDYCADMSPDFCKDHPYNDCRGPGFFHKCQKHCRGCIGKPLEDCLQAVKGFKSQSQSKNKTKAYFNKFLFIEKVCITKNKSACKFPFTYDGKTYWACTRDGGYDTPWCKTVEGSWDYCPQEQLLANPGCTYFDFTLIHFSIIRQAVS